MAENFELIRLIRKAKPELEVMGILIICNAEAWNEDAILEWFKLRRGANGDLELI